jgi:hypothetical protein
MVVFLSILKPGMFALPERRRGSLFFASFVATESLILIVLGITGFFRSIFRN